MKQQLALNVLSQPEPSLENFVVGENKQLLELLNNLPKSQALYMWGHPGCGKTHLLKAVTNQYQGQYFNNKNFSTLNFENIPDLVAIDDIEEFEPKNQNHLFKLYYEWKKRQNTEQSFRIILSANCPPLTLKVREDLRNRLGYDLVFRIKELGDEDLVYALSHRTKELGCELSPTLPKWLFNHYSRNISLLFDLFSKLDVFSLEKKTKHFTIALVKDFLEKHHE